MRVLDVDGGPETARIFGDVVTEDDRPHGRLAGAGFALGMSCQRCSREPVGRDTYHEEHLLLPALSFLHRGGGRRCSLLLVGGCGGGKRGGCGLQSWWVRGDRGARDYLRHALAGCDRASGTRVITRCPDTTGGGGGPIGRTPSGGREGSRFKSRSIRSDMAFSQAFCLGALLGGPCSREGGIERGSNAGDSSVAATSDIVPPSPSRRHAQNGLLSLSRHPECQTFPYILPLRPWQRGQPRCPGHAKRGQEQGRNRGPPRTRESRDSLIPDSSFHALPYHSSTRQV